MSASPKRSAGNTSGQSPTLSTTSQHSGGRSASGPASGRSPSCGGCSPAASAWSARSAAGGRGRRRLGLPARQLRPLPQQLGTDSGHVLGKQHGGRAAPVCFGREQHQTDEPHRLMCGGGVVFVVVHEGQVGVPLGRAGEQRFVMVEYLSGGRGLEEKRCRAEYRPHLFRLPALRDAAGGGQSFQHELQSLGQLQEVGHASPPSAPSVASGATPATAAGVGDAPGFAGSCSDRKTVAP